MNTNIKVDNLHITEGMTLSEKLAALKAKQAAIAAARLIQEQEEAEIQAEIDAERKANRAAFINGLVNDIATKIQEFGDDEVYSLVADEVDALAPKSHKGGPRLSEEEMNARNAAIVEALKVEGATAEKVANQFGVSAGTVNLVKRGAGLTAPRKTGKTKEVFKVEPIILGTPAA